MFRQAAEPDDDGRPPEPAVHRGGGLAGAPKKQVDADEEFNFTRLARD